MEIQNNKKKVDELVELFCSRREEEFNAKVQEYVTQLSYNICTAISPINDLVLPFVVFALQSYIDTLTKGNEEYVDNMVKSLIENSKSAVITIPFGESKHGK